MSDPNAYGGRVEMKEAEGLARTKSGEGMGSGGETVDRKERGLGRGGWQRGGQTLDGGRRWGGSNRQE